MNNRLQLSLLDREWVNINSPLVLTAMNGRDFSSDDLHTILPQPDNNNLYGVLVAHLRCAGAIIRVGSVKSRRKSANGRYVGLYRVHPPESELPTLEEIHSINCATNADPADTGVYGCTCGAESTLSGQMGSTLSTPKA